MQHFRATIAFAFSLSASALAKLRLPLLEMTLKMEKVEVSVKSVCNQKGSLRRLPLLKCTYVAQFIVVGLASTPILESGLDSTMAR